MVVRRAVFLDRDGVINQSVVRGGKPYPPAALSDMTILPGVPEALLRLREAGLLNVVVTNQPDVATGRQARDVVEAMHAHLMDRLAIDAVRVCYHDDAAACDCRKPRPGMLIDAARDLHIDIARSAMVGDRWRDIGAGQAAGCTSYFIDYGYDERRPEKPYIEVKSLADAADRILRG